MYESGRRSAGAILADPEPDQAGLLDALAAGWLHLENDGSGAPEPWLLTDKGLLRELECAGREVARCRARWLALLAEAEQREATTALAGMPTSSWLTDQNTHWASSARDEVRFATQLARAPQVAAALGRGELSVEQARVVVQGLNRLPDGLDQTQCDAVAAQLVGFGSEFGPYGLSRLVNRAVEVVAPEVAEEADRKAMARVEADQARDRYLNWRKDSEGAIVIRGKLGKVAGQQLIGTLRALAVRQRGAAALAGQELSHAQANADALVTLVEHFASCGEAPSYGADRPRVLVAVELAVLREGLGRATLLNSGDPITPGEARRLACDAGILPVVMAGRSVPLDAGREQRLFTGTLRAVMVARDQGCAFPGCDRGPSDCEGHHLRPWWAGGHTSLGNGVLLCTFHHHLVEPDPNAPPGSQWQIRLDPRGLAEFGAPEGLGAPPGERRWRQHHRYRTG